jgi:carbonic anhydrase
MNIDQLRSDKQNIFKRSSMKTRLLLSLLFITFTMTNCSSRSKKQETKVEPTPQVITSTAVTPAAATPPPAAAPTATATSKELTELKESIKKAEAVTNKKEDTHHAAEPAKEQHKADHHHKPEGVPAEKALGWLKNGNTRYTKGFLRKDGISKKDIEKLSTGQAPHSIILSCSDSRVPPELVFDQKLGEIFVIRTAGQSLDNAALASIEYAIEHLGSQLIVVMGHTSCGAVTAAHGAAPGADIGSPYLNALVADIQPRMASRLNTKASESFETEGWDNTKGAAKALLEKSKIIREAVKAGHLRIESALYHLKSGKVDWSQ